MDAQRAPAYSQHPMTTYLSSEETALVGRAMAAGAIDTNANALRHALYKFCVHMLGPKEVPTHYFALQVERSHARRKKMGKR